MKKSTIISGNIQKMMFSRNMSAEMLSKASGIPLCTINQYIDEVSCPKEKNIKKLVATFGCEEEDIYPKPKPKKDSKKSITEIAILAREEGMSYGKCVAKYHL